MYEKHRSKRTAIEIVWCGIFIKKHTKNTNLISHGRSLISPRWWDGKQILQASGTQVRLWVFQRLRLRERLLDRQKVSMWSSSCAEIWGLRCPSSSIPVEDCGQTAPSTWGQLRRRASTRLETDRNKAEEWLWVVYPNLWFQYGLTCWLFFWFISYLFLFF